MAARTKFSTKHDGYGAIPRGVRGPSSHEQSAENGAVFTNSWRSICLTSWAVFLSIMIIFKIDEYTSSTPLCSHSDKDFGNIYEYVCYANLGACAMLWLVIIYRLVNSDISERRRAPYYFALNMVTLSLISMSWSRLDDSNNVCIDRLNVAKLAATKAEWLSSAPLNVLCCIIVVDKPSISRIEWGITASFCVSTLSFFCLIFPQPFPSAMLLLALSIATFVPILFLPHYLTMPSDVHDMSKKLNSSNIPILEEAHKMRFFLSVFLVCFFSVFPFAYLAAMFGFLDAALSVVFFQTFSVFTKGLFAAACMDVHEGVLKKTIQSLAAEQQANDARRSFMKYIFHEIRTPLNSISMGLEMVEESQGLDPLARESVENMKEATLFMSDTLNDVLSLQQIEEGNVEIDLVPFSFSPMLSRIVSTFKASLISHRIHLSFAISPLLKKNEAIGDRHRIEHVVSNLVSNAIKFSPDGGAVHIEVSCKHDIEVSQQYTNVPVTVAVIDHGCGISEEDQLKLFNNFVQIRPGLLQEGKGSGLGLSFCKEIVELHGGAVSCTSAVGEGSTFSFTIPFNLIKKCLTSSEIKPCATLTDPNNETSPKLAHALNALVVDDSASNRRMLSMILKVNDVVHETAENGRVAVDMVKADPFKYQLILMDNLMPVMNGVEATKELRALGFPYLIVGVTGNVMDDDVAEYLNSGADKVLLQPIKVATIRMLLQHIASHGPRSIPGMVLEASVHGFEWVPRSSV